MSDELRPQSRPLRAEEKAILSALLSTSSETANEILRTRMVEDMPDGGMGSIRFVCEQVEPRSFGAKIAEAEYVDADGVLVSITVNIDDQGELYEVDFWKVDFSPLRKYPTPERLWVKSKIKN